MAIDVERLQKLSLEMSHLISDPAGWSHVLAEIAKAAGAMGAGLIPRAAAAGALASPNLEDCLTAYFAEGWFDESRESRKRILQLQFRGKVVFDQDIIACDQIGCSSFFDGFLPRFDGKWWAGIPIRSGSDVWCLALHRSRTQGQFSESERAAFEHLSSRLNEIAGIAEVVGHALLSDVITSLDQVSEAAIAIDETGRVIRVNSAADHILGDAVHVVHGRLELRDPRAATEYLQLLECLRGRPAGEPLHAAPIVVRRKNSAPLLVEVLSINRAARLPFLHTRALVLLKDIGRVAKSDGNVLCRAFGLTPAEARLAVHLSNGASLKDAAEMLRITKETARSRLKAVFQKTDVHRQGELVALLSAVRRSSRSHFPGLAIGPLTNRRRWLPDAHDQEGGDQML